MESTRRFKASLTFCPTSSLAMPLSGFIVLQPDFLIINNAGRINYFMMVNTYENEGY
ncbi:hypothetical protein N018_12665 [Pseudomonas syringae CC1557]|uniref:Uncharacterized protein n=1 Tax=Pseudomonas syringae CC1557 TaxID=1357279 RepID=W0N3G2_PSESX|nr:hypothetical protein N018_12665 [Pseudomonas syringae CC1557]